MRKIQTGRRIPESRYEELVQFSEAVGVSINASILMLIEIGMQAVNRGEVQFPRVPLRKREGTAE